MGTGDQRGFGPAYYTDAIEYLAGNGDGSFQGSEIFTTPTPNATNLPVTADFNVRASYPGGTPPNFTRQLRSAGSAKSPAPAPSLLTPESE
jgi:hypothetical protein